MKKSSRRQALEEWRGLPDSEPKPDRTILVRDVLAQLAPKLGFENRLREEEILSVWGELVGPFFAQHSRPTKLIQGVLQVQVLQPTVLYELDRQWKPVVLQKLKARFGARLIKDVRFRLG
jgi:predicted nucleic acid-binding Zn ribbon protein